MHYIWHILGFYPVSRKWYCGVNIKILTYVIQDDLNKWRYRPSSGWSHVTEDNSFRRKPYLVTYALAQASGPKSLAHKAHCSRCDYRRWQPPSHPEKNFLPQPIGGSNIAMPVGLHWAKCTSAYSSPAWLCSFIPGNSLRLRLYLLLMYYLHIKDTVIYLLEKHDYVSHDQ